MSRSSGRGQVEPLAALAALAVLGVTLSAWAGAFAAVRPDPPERDVAPATLQRSVERLRSNGSVRPGRLDLVDPPTGYRLNATLRAAGRRWSRGPTPPTDAGAAGRTVPVRVAATRVRPGRLRVVVWR
ncbi:MAG: hypothetical protein ABEJ70_00800 [Halobacteriaceae archaeon]